jgi:uncharacterized protein YegJ (DUF2314 family)
LLGSRQMQHHPVAVALAVLVVAAGCSQPMTEFEKEYEAERMRSEARARQQAAQKAQATLDDFLVKAKQLPAGTRSYALKVAIRDGGGTEYFWIDEFSWSDGTFTGRIKDEPRLVKSVKPGQVHTFSRSDIVDWTYFDENSSRTFGNFTASAPPGVRR